MSKHRYSENKEGVNQEARGTRKEAGISKRESSGNKGTIPNSEHWQIQNCSSLFA